MEQEVKKYKWIVTGCILVIVLGLYWWRLTQPIRIGVIYSTETTMGTEANLAMRYYGTRFDRIKSRRVEFLVRNPALQKKDIVRAYRELEEENVSIIIGGGVSASGTILAEEAKRSQIPTFGTTTSTQFLTGLKDNFYRPVMGTDRQAENIARFLEGMEIQRLAIVPHVMNTAYGTSYAKSLEKYFPGVSTTLPFTPEAGLYDKLREFNPDVVFVILPPPAILRFMKEAGLKPSTMLISSEWGFSLPQYSGPLEDLIYIATQNGQATPGYRELVTGFESVYDQPATFCTEYTFSTLDIIYEAMEKVGDDPDKLNAYFREPRIYDYAYGKIYINEYGDGIHEYYYIYTLKEGNLEIHRRFPMKDFPQM